MTVNEFLSLLSICWLTGQPLSIEDNDLDVISRLASQRGLETWYQKLRPALTGGVPVSSLMSGKELGQFQLAIADG